MSENIQIILYSLILSKISYHDIKDKKIPNKYVFMLFVMLLIRKIAISQFYGYFFEEWMQLFTGALAGFLILLPAYFITGKGFGMGDIKLVTVLGAVLGAKLLLISVFFSMLFALVFYVARAIKRKDAKAGKIAMAPFLMYGYLVVKSGIIGII